MKVNVIRDPTVKDDLYGYMRINKKYLVGVVDACLYISTKDFIEIKDMIEKTPGSLNTYEIDEETFVYFTLRFRLEFH